MRLNHYEIESIKKAFQQSFEDGEVYLFGSRLDDNKRGGDIDLYLCPSKKFANEGERKIDFLVLLQTYIGEQKIDAIMATDNNRAIEKTALNEGINLHSNHIKLEKYLNECGKHVLRIRKAYSKIRKVLPLSSTQYQNLSDDEVAAIDQFLFRFSKLQDTLGDKIFRLIISEYRENTESLTFIDILNLLEKIGILHDAKTWNKLRSTRNTISHQYDDEPEEMAKALNDIFAHKDDLLRIYDEINRHCQSIK